jgi:hypothetical protein
MRTLLTIVMMALLLWQPLSRSANPQPAAPAIAKEGVQAVNTMRPRPFRG